MTGWLNSEPKLVARGSEIFLHNKARAIYGTEPIDYTIMSYAFLDMEIHFFVLLGVTCGLSGMAETAVMLRRLELIKHDGVLGIMFDYVGLQRL